VHGDVGDDEVGRQQPREHVGADVAGRRDLRRLAPGDAEPLQRRVDQLAGDPVEVDLAPLQVVLLAERPDDEGAQVPVVGGGVVAGRGAVGAHGTSSAGPTRATTAVLGDAA
jgi:hypothetical protein